MRRGRRLTTRQLLDIVAPIEKPLESPKEIEETIETVEVVEKKKGRPRKE